MVEFGDVAARIAGELTGVAADLAGRRLFLATMSRIYAFDANQCLWVSPVVSTAGVARLEYEGGRLTGFGFGLKAAPMPFQLDASTGRHEPIGQTA